MTNKQEKFCSKKVYVYLISNNKQLLNQKIRAYLYTVGGNICVWTMRLCGRIVLVRSGGGGGGGGCRWRSKYIK
ncbi:hypothetical protein DERP_010559 [Dermatophagoides pteronyssinus]|uniref:Uncharacterized protein n=1 Tax=Dermatophagoides pteronyssinus TaxID=6956 RepID=A0ABQ8JG67_DERPT|nr:hypothetical protein DERP_010559 [Dermatophagoides pteronyssinus]